MDSQTNHAGVHNVPALEKAIRLLGALAAGDGGGGSAALAQRLGISQSTCYRTLQTLEAADWVRATGDGGYALSLGLLPLLRPLQAIERRVAVLKPTVKALSEATGLTVKLSLRQGFDQVTVARAESSRPLSVTSPIGARFPVIAGASGACLLSSLADPDVDRVVAHADREHLWEHETAVALRTRIAACRRKGICDNLGAHPQGIDTVSVPLPADDTPFALTIVGLRGDFDGTRGADIRKHLLHAARDAAARLRDVSASIHPALHTAGHPTP